MSESRKSLFVVGATGFTGRRICFYIAKYPPHNLSWAVCGRNIQKLTELVEELKEFKVALPAIIVKDVLHDNLIEIGEYKVCISCVGPFRFYGKPVVEACIKYNTDYVDICGETEFIERIYAEYNQNAISSKVAIIPSCGYDSLPSDMGVLFAKSEFAKLGGRCFAIEMFVRLLGGNGKLTFNATTFTAAIHSFENVGNLRELRKKSHRSLEYLGSPLKLSKGIAWNKRLKVWTVPMMVADVPVVILGQQILETHKDATKNGVKQREYEPVDLNPVRIGGYFQLNSFIAVLFMIYVQILLKLLIIFKPIKELAIKYPSVFTFGFFKNTGPTEEQLQMGSFRNTFISKGFVNESRKNPDLESEIKELITTVSGPESGYVTTPICVVEAAKMLLLHRNKIPNGVLTPASAFNFVADEFIQQLSSHGVEFAVNSINSI